MKLRGLYGVVCALVAVLASGCSAGKYLQEGQHVLYNNVIDLQMADSTAVTPEVRDALKKVRSYYAQVPNSKFLGGPRVGMRIYCLSSPKRHGMFNNYLRRLGQAPVVYDAAKIPLSVRQLSGLMEQKGCFGSQVWADTLQVKKHDISIAYHVRATPRYAIDEVNYHCANPEVNRLLEDWQPQSLLQVGDYYDQEHISSERDRIVSNLREEGYFHASRQLVHFVVDTTYSRRRLSIDVYVDSTNLRVYHINNVFVYPNSTARLITDATSFDTLIHTYPLRSRMVDYQFVYDQPMTIRPQTISRAMLLFPGITYRPRYETNTYNALLNLRNFKYINIEFTEAPSSTPDLPLVDAHVRLINATQQKLSLSVELTNASPLTSVDSSVSPLSLGNFGIETAIEYQHKNLFHGAELFKLKTSLLMELPKLASKGGRGVFYDNFSTFEATLEATLDMPTFLLPIQPGIVWQRVHPHTLVTLGGSYQYHYYFERILGNASFGYTWSSNLRRQHQLLPIELTYVSMLGLDDAFRQRLDAISDLRLKYQYSSHFILDARYDYRYSNQHLGSRVNFHAFHFSIESAGNLLDAVSRLTRGTVDSAGVRQMFGVPFSQYERFTTDYTRYYYIGSRSAIVLHGAVGIGLPFGNSQDMPYEKSFFGGGTTSLRAWQLRRLGPGAYRASDAVIDRVGDMQLVLNLEGRFPIVSSLEGALFLDAGNVWLYNPSSQFPDGHFVLSQFWRQIAVGFGFGLRLNVSLATLRLDFGIPLFDPAYSSPWRLPHWRFNQIVTNLGIGYPF